MKSTEIPATMMDIAREAQVSAATVSRVMNGNYPVKEGIKLRVLAAARQLGYTPRQKSPASASLDIGVIIPNISNPFYPQTILGVENVALMHNSNLLVCSTLHDKGREQRYLRSLYEKNVRGIIISSADMEASHLSEYITKGMSFVLLDQKVENVDCPFINFDARKGARMAVKALFEMGHRQIALASTPITRWTRSEILAGYREEIEACALPDAGLVFVPENEKDVVLSDYEFTMGLQLCRQFLQSGKKCTAVICVNDMVACGFMQGLQREGIKVPQDISVIGFDDIPLASLVYPALSTIRHQTYECGKLAATMLFNALQSKEDLALTVNLEPTLVMRESVRRI